MSLQQFVHWGYVPCASISGSILNVGIQSQRMFHMQFVHRSLTSANKDVHLKFLNDVSIGCTLVSYRHHLPGP
jgi:hypothetical protein